MRTFKILLCISLSTLTFTLKAHLYFHRPWPCPCISTLLLQGFSKIPGQVMNGETNLTTKQQPTFFQQIWDSQKSIVVSA